MAVVVHIVIRGLSPEQYDRVREEVGWLQRPPEGGIVHLTWWEGEDCHNMDPWESEAAFAAFGETRLGPAMARLGINAPVEPTFHPAHEVFTPSSRRWFSFVPNAGSGVRSTLPSETRSLSRSTADRNRRTVSIVDR